MERWHPVEEEQLFPHRPEDYRSEQAQRREVESQRACKKDPLGGARLRGTGMRISRVRLGRRQILVAWRIIGSGSLIIEK